MKKLYYLGRPADGFGWGVANTNLVRELGNFFRVIVETSNRTNFDAPVFVPIADQSLRPVRVVQAPKRCGYCFTEWPLTDQAKDNAGQYDVIFTGSTWNTEKLKAAGIDHAVTMIQGVDFDRFRPVPPSDQNLFVVFSGGKYELRKGQDYVLAAMKHLMRLHPDVILLAAWHNPWPKTMASMQDSRLIDASKPFEGLPKDRVFQVGNIPNAETPGIYAQAHVGLFPNRCEAGTNMVMAEFMACGRAVIASDAHGHKDVLGPATLKLSNGSYDALGWFHPNLDDIIAQLEYAYSHRDDLVQRGVQCAENMKQFTWRACAEKVYAALN